MKKPLLILLLLNLSFAAFSQSAGDFYKRAVVKFKNTDYAGAAIEYTRAIELNQSSVLYGNRGVCYYKIERFDQALADYEQAIVKDANNADAHYNMGNLLKHIERNDEALIAYDKAILSNPRDKRFYQNRGTVKSFLGDDLGAIEDFNKVLEIKPNDTKATYNRGTSYVALKEYKLAKIDFDRALQLDPKYYKALINRGICYVQLDQNNEAKKDFTLAVSLSPANGEGYYYRALATINDMNLIKSENKDKHNINLIQENVYAQKAACSDFEKAKQFQYSRSYSALNEHCL
jgi:tetratricopeptide (TPR) repeat protein